MHFLRQPHIGGLLPTDRYEDALRRGVGRLWAGDDAKTILDDVAKEWDAITERIGIENQKAAHAAWTAKPRAYPK